MSYSCEANVAQLSSAWQLEGFYKSIGKQNEESPSKAFSAKERNSIYHQIMFKPG